MPRTYTASPPGRVSTMPGRASAPSISWRPFGRSPRRASSSYTAMTTTPPTCRWPNSMPRTCCSRIPGRVVLCRASMAARCARSCRGSISGRAPNGYGASSSWLPTAPGSGRSGAITTTAIPGRRSAMADAARPGFALVVALGLALVTAAIPAQSKGGPGMSAYDFTFTSIDGAPLPLARYRGHPLLVVNTASFCGFTYQYQDLEALWRSYRERGLVVIGVPSNDFGAQEPGSATEIKQFCEGNYAVDFPLADKQTVIGDKAHPFFRWIADELGEAGTPRWNFHKYLIAPDGSIAGAWPSRVRPTDKEITAEVE